jgi:uncharacterized DUF497 family protein
MDYSAVVRVSWDEDKNRANKKRHGLTFEEASEVFTSGVDCLISARLATKREREFYGEFILGKPR